MEDSTQQQPTSRGGYIPGPVVTVKTRLVGDRMEYWEPIISAWVTVISPQEIKAYGMPRR